jgi:hypothetical protein
VLPFHSLIFPAMSRNITAAARKITSAKESSAEQSSDNETQATT